MRARRSLLNFATTVLFGLITTLIAVAATPTLIDWVGENRFGAYRVVLAWSGYLALLELGLGGSLGPLLAGALGRGDAGGLRATLSAGIRAYAKVVATAMIVGALLTIFIDRALKNPSPEIVEDLRSAWLVSLLGFVPLALTPFRALTEARQLGYRANLLQIGQSLLITATALVLAKSGRGATGQAIAQAVGIWAFYLILTWDGLRPYPGLARSVLAESPDAETRRALRGLSVPTLIFTIASRISLMSDDIVIGAILGDVAVTRLYIAQRLPVMAQAQLQGVGTATWAAMAELIAKGDRETFNRRLVELTRLVAILAVAGLAPIVAYNRRFIELWKPGDYPGLDAVTAISALNALILSIGSLWGWCFGGTGRIRLLLVPSIAGAVVNVLFSVLLTDRLGIVGPLLGTTISYAAITLPWQILLLKRVFKTSPRRLLEGFLIPVAWGIPYLAVLWRLAGAHRPWGWIGLAAEMSAAVAGYLAIAAIAVLNSSERRIWVERIRGMTRRG